MNYEIDHIFQIVENEEEAYKLANATGLKVFPKRDHEGQGTSAIFLIFEKNYFEYIWLRDEEEARTNMLRWDLKQKAFLNGGSPFGVAFRGVIPIELENKFVEYKPKYGVGRYQIYMLQESIENPMQPKFFFMQNPDRPNFSDWHPERLYNDQKQLCNFEHVIKEFMSVKIVAKEFPQRKFEKVEFLEGESFLQIRSGVEFKLNSSSELN